MEIPVFLVLQVPILCTKDGLWTEEFKLCDDLQGECSPPQELNSVEYKCEQGYGIGKSPYAALSGGKFPLAYGNTAAAPNLGWPGT